MYIEFDWRPRRSTTLFWGSVAAVAFALSLLAHVLTYVPRPPFLGWLPLVFFLIFPALGALGLSLPGMLSRMRRGGIRAEQEPDDNWLYLHCRGSGLIRETMGRLFDLIPLIVRLIGLLLGVYVLLSTLISMAVVVAAKGDAPGHLATRIMSGHLMFFAMFPTIGFLILEPEVRAYAAEIEDGADSMEL